MTDYQVIARKFRPQTFSEVVGQEAILTTLKNAIQKKRLAQAYLFCGSRGTGKTTLARLLAKSLNCHQPDSSCEPCNQCSSCHDIALGISLNVTEIDGASHRGIEDIRQITEAVGIASSGNYKIYIIDEVHMLTKEAFNALLKTLEEPPPKVKFFFATTEPHKVLPTILSRCQRFNLNRIPTALIVAKLQRVAAELKVEVEEEALYLLARRAEGGLRDAESLLDQILAFEEGPVTANSVTKVLGLLPRDIYFEIDKAGKEGNLAKAFEIAQRVFSEGKELSFFIEGLIDHFRQILLIKISGPNPSIVDQERYAQSATFYSREQSLDLIEYLLQAQTQMRTSSFGQISLEVILLHVMRSHFRISIEQLVRHLSDLEQSINENCESNDALESSKEEVQTTAQNPIQISNTPLSLAPPQLQVNHLKPSSLETLLNQQTSINMSIDPTPTAADLGKKMMIKQHVEIPKKIMSPKSSNSTASLQKPIHSSPASQTDDAGSVCQEEDDLGWLEELQKANASFPSTGVPLSPSQPDLSFQQTALTESNNPSSEQKKTDSEPLKTIFPAQTISKHPVADNRPAHAYDTLMHFATVEFEGKLQKK